jgi:hypothetical protein
MNAINIFLCVISKKCIKTMEYRVCLPACLSIRRSACVSSETTEQISHIMHSEWPSTLTAVTKINFGS